MPGDFSLESFDFARHAVDDVIRFWVEHAVDEEYGGFWTHLRRDGSRSGDGRKFLVMQARMVYSMTIAYRLSGDDEFLELAQNGANFLMDNFWDAKYGGWYWSVERDGKKTRSLGISEGLEKRAYGHAFAIYGLAEFARESGDHRASEMSLETYEIMFEKMWDKNHGGLYLQFDEDWYLRDPTKRLDVHLHALEGLSSLAALTDDSWFRDEMIKICDLICDRMHDEQHGCMREWFLPNWRENLDRTRGLINYGHNLETAWFLWVIGDSLGIDGYSGLAEKLIDFSTREGVDDQHGGVYDTGVPGDAPVSRRKVWWNQCEGIGAFSYAYRRTEESIYRDHLESVARFAYLNLFDDKYGEWFTCVSEDGSIIDSNKGGTWKAAYHVVQACYHAHRNLTDEPRQPDTFQSGLL